MGTVKLWVLLFPCRGTRPALLTWFYWFFFSFIFFRRIRYFFFFLAWICPPSSKRGEGFIVVVCFCILWGLDWVLRARYEDFFFFFSNEFNLVKRRLQFFILIASGILNEGEFPDISPSTCGMKRENKWINNAIYCCCYSWKIIKRNGPNTVRRVNQEKRFMENLILGKLE